MDTERKKNRVYFEAMALSCPPHKTKAVFIVGIPRSGTTWLLSILSQHPDFLAITPEMLGIKANHPTMETGLFIKGFPDSEILRRWNKLPDDRILVEKTPAHIAEADRIKKLLGARIILIHRNRLDVICSMLKPNPFWTGSPKTFDAAIKIYNKFNVQVSADYTVSYEDLWANPVDESKRLFAFLGVSTSSTRDIVTVTNLGKSLPLKLKSVFDKGTPGQGEHLKEFTDRIQ